MLLRIGCKCIYVQLDALPLRQKRRVTSIDWGAIPLSEGHRLRSLGLDAGVMVEPLHRGILFWRDPIAVRVGRMTIALRRQVAAAICCADAFDEELVQ
jgi:ferrous iron transport protein A